MILVGMLLSAVQRARGAALLTACSSNLRQVGIGLHDYYNGNDVFPSNGGWDSKQTILSTTGTPFTPETLDYTTNTAYPWGTGDPSLTPEKQTGSWAYSILPYLDQDSMFQEQRWTQGMQVYICPARRPAAATSTVQIDAYAEYVSGGWVWGKTDYAGNLNVFKNRPTCVRKEEFTQGMSNTVLVGEKAFNTSIQGRNWYFDEPFFLGGSKGTHRGSLHLSRDGNNGNAYKEGWGSPHRHGVNFLFGDGSVRMQTFDTDVATMTSILSLDGITVLAVPGD
jgi:prepilin-type processing-associated H-X9-DG protein